MGGSEHTINGKRYAAEFHLVHYNSKYNSLNDAAPNADGLAVIGIMLELFDESTYEAELANNFVKYFKNVPHTGDHYTINNKSEFRTIRDLIKSDVEDYYTYQGKRLEISRELKNSEFSFKVRLQPLHAMSRFVGSSPKNPSEFILLNSLK